MSSPKRLYRNSAAGRIAGVCAGIAEYLDADVTLIRLVWVVLSIVPGGFVGGIVAYLAAWAIMPDSTIPSTAEAGIRRLTRSTTDQKLGGVCGGLAEYFGVDSTMVRVLWAILTIIPGAIVLGVVAYLVAWFIMPSSPATHVVVTPSVA
jgi:phage shock protein PspC (stress-responsive transcriptional regulator)